MENALKLRNLSKTRWTARAESIRAMLSSFEEIKATLLSISSNKNKFHTSTWQHAKKSQFKNGICWLNNIINVYEKHIAEKKQMTTSLQVEELNILDAVEIIKLTIASLTAINEDKASMNDQIRQVLHCQESKV